MSAPMNAGCKPSPCDKPGCGSDGCVKYGYDFADISVPVEIRPETCVGRIEMECIGEPYAECEFEPCESRCRIIITQRVKLKIPVRFTISADAGNGVISCEGRLKPDCGSPA